MSGMEILIPLSVVASFVAVVALGVFIVVRFRAGDTLLFSFRTILLAYVYFMSIASLLVFTGGLSVGVKALLSDAFGREFSYHVPREQALLRSVDVKSGDDSEDPAMQAKELQEEMERSNQRIERQYKSDLVQAGTLVLIGGVLWGLHSMGRRRFQHTDNPYNEFFYKTYLAILLALFGVTGIISLTSGVYETLRFFLIPPDEFSFGSPPGDAIGAAIVFVPVWGYYLLSMLRLSDRESSRAEEQPA